MKKAYRILFASLFVILLSVTISLIGCAKKEFTVSYLSGDGGYVSGETTQIVRENESTQPVFVNPLDGYYFDGWSDGDGHFVRSDKNVTADITVTATFKRRTFSVQYVADPNGTIQGEKKQTVNMYDDSTEVTAVADDGFEFIGWTDGVTEATRYEKRVESNFKVYAKFAIKTYSVKFSAETHGTVTGTCEQTVEHGDNHSTVTAIPDWGYVFVGWTDGVTEATRSDTVIADIDATARFKKGFEGGDGSVRNPFKISTYKQFCNIVSYPAEYFKLINDLDLTGINHRPLFEEDKPTAGVVQPFTLNRSGENESFSGEFDGCGHSIKNLTVDCDSEYPSLFGVLGGGGYVKNLNIVNASIATTDFDTSKGKYFVGILAGVLNCFAQNVTVSGEIIIDGLSHDGVAIGGLAGQAFCPMINCSGNVDIRANKIESNKIMTANPFCIGGLAGVCSSWSVADCISEGTITVNDSEATVLVGGLIGYCFGNVPDIGGGENVDGVEEDLGAAVRIVNCNSFVNIVENNSQLYAAGFIGNLTTDEVEISDCSSNGDIQANVASGFFYHVSAGADSVIEKCRSEGDLICYGSAFGFARYISNYTFSKCSVSGNITAAGYVCGFFQMASNVTFKDCSVESELSGKFVGGFGYMSMSGTVFERCSFTGSIQCGKQGAGICFRTAGTKIKNCYSTGNISVVNAENPNEILGIGGICARSDDSQIKNCYFAGTITVEAEYPSNSYLGIFVGRNDNSAITNCHTLISENSEIKTVVGISVGDTNEYDIVSYNSVEEMYDIADALNLGQEQAVWENTPNGLPKLKL